MAVRIPVLSVDGVHQRLGGLLKQGVFSFLFFFIEFYLPLMRLIQRVVQVDERVDIKQDGGRGQHHVDQRYAVAEILDQRRHQRRDGVDDQGKQDGAVQAAAVLNDESQLEQQNQDRNGKAAEVARSPLIGVLRVEGIIQPGKL